jgi:hypothetical protein
MIPANAQTEDPIIVSHESVAENFYKVKDLYSLRPTYQMEIDDFFLDNAQLIECNQQLVTKVKKIKALKDFKYFETNGGFGIISEFKDVEEKDENGRPHRNFLQRFFGIGASTNTCQRVYIFLVIKNELNEELIPNYVYLFKTYKTRQLERKWANIATLEALLKNPESKYNSQQHSFVMRVYEFKKGQLAKDFKFVTGDNTYMLDPKVQELFKR